MTRAAIVMAAGAGRRMGGIPKPLICRDGEPLICRQIRLLRAAGMDGGIAVVLGHHAERVRSVLQPQVHVGRAQPGELAVLIAINPEPDRGTPSSLQCGLRALPARMDAWVVVLADQPLLELQELRTVLQTWESRGKGIDLVIASHAGQPGHPLVFGQKLRDDVLASKRGIRAWRQEHPSRVRLLNCHSERCVTDLDTPDDLIRVASRFGIQLELPESDHGMLRQTS